ncbi:hypothetical protein BDN70DRAFT_877628 [Pholiota conissans]|uniref:Uncharacterized protein n=1 Tax=Pholiota conissans TaxID=109636 RepID=A0A9P5Z440_9AGAR|nr:hypothetical protein BDN70DRAFT_877628 [Pholiota conissans]
MALVPPRRSYDPRDTSRLKLECAQVQYATGSYYYCHQNWACQILYVKFPALDGRLLFQACFSVIPRVNEHQKRHLSGIIVTEALGAMINDKFGFSGKCGINLRRMVYATYL